MQLDKAGRMAGVGVKLIFNLENTVAASNVELFSNDCVSATLSIVT